MKPSGVLLFIAGVWVLCQAFKGQALQRLGVIGGGAPGSTSSGSGSGSGGSAPPGTVGGGSVTV